MEEERGVTYVLFPSFDLVNAAKLLVPNSSTHEFVLESRNSITEYPCCFASRDGPRTGA